jgi:hypothetical protein
MQEPDDQAAAWSDTRFKAFLESHNDDCRQRNRASDQGGPLDPVCHVCTAAKSTSIGRKIARQCLLEGSGWEREAKTKSFATGRKGHRCVQLFTKRPQKAEPEPAVSLGIEAWGEARPIVDHLDLCDSGGILAATDQDRPRLAFSAGMLDGIREHLGHNLRDWQNLLQPHDASMLKILAHPDRTGEFGTKRRTNFMQILAQVGELIPSLGG